ncbi:hypothetical protein IQ13_2666 [Lacibacter cauensis]|uniref:Lipoprotein n=1 Tax=Lacibacter cauensis TaxID=510947 RepID=A0A562SKF3_9BACT|nr:hypothetical protein [Lacibacter cauensis]TWI81648.1 hypothetical protein IQ13_2666 [Lacibacter cauensis]
MKHFLILAFTLALFTSCKKEIQCTDGMIRWGGEPAADGLGWYFVSADLGNKPVKLKNLPENYLLDSLKVTTCVQPLTEKYQCFCATPLDMYKVLKISRR